LGQVYNGQLLKGIFGLGGLLGLLLLSTAFGLTHSLNGLVVHNILLVSAYVFLLGDAVFTAVRQARMDQHPAHTWRSYVVGVFLLVTIFVLSSIVPDRIPGVRAYKMTAESMSPTLASEDRIVADMRYYRSHTPLRGDLIVFIFPYQDHPVYIKRVIGVPGDRVKIVDHQVYVNGQRISEPYIVRDLSASFDDPFGDNFPPHGPEYLQANMQPEWADEIFHYVHDYEITVPPDKYFTMGDNRDHSWDSRYWGPIARDKILGKALYIYWSKDKSRIGQTIR
jgi:signal peptidase I